MRNFSIALLLVAAFCSVIGSSANTCANSSLNGTYFYVLTGNIFVSNFGFFCAEYPS